MFVRDSALCCHGGTPDGRLRCTRGRRTRSGEPRDRCGRLVSSSVLPDARTGEAGRYCRARCGFLDPYGAAMSIDTPVRLGSNTLFTEQRAYRSQQRTVSPVTDETAQLQCTTEP